MSNVSLKDTCKRYNKAGLSCVPAIKAEKRPVGNWKIYQTRQPTEEEIEGLFAEYPNADALAIICGRVSGGLEVLDFDFKGVSFEPWLNNIGAYFEKDERFEPLSGRGNNHFEELVQETTQNGGLHVAYRIEGGTAEKNQKLTLTRYKKELLTDGRLNGKPASYDAENEPYFCTIETRGEGGLIIGAPTDGYELEDGEWTKIPTISKLEADLYKEAAFALSTAKMKALVKRPPKPERLYAQDFNNFSAGEYLKENTNVFANYLTDRGWQYIATKSDGSTLWRRPGKEQGISAQWSNTGVFSVYTSSVKVEPGSYTPLKYIALDSDETESEISKCIYKHARENNDLPISSGQMSLPFAIHEKATAEEIEKAESIDLKNVYGKRDCPNLSNKLLTYLSDSDSFLARYVKECKKAQLYSQYGLFLGSGLSALASITSPCITFNKKKCNLNIMLVSEPSTGKNISLSLARQVCARLAKLAVRPGFGSYSAFCKEAHDEKSHTLVWNKDEIHEYFNGLSKNSLQNEIFTSIVGLYSNEMNLHTSVSSKANTQMNVKKLGSDEQATRQSFDFRVYVNALLTTQPYHINKIINSPAGLNDGSLSRFLFCAGANRIACNKEQLALHKCPNNSLSDKEIESVFSEQVTLFTNLESVVWARNKVNPIDDFVQFAPPSDHVDRSLEWNDEFGFDIPLEEGVDPYDYEERYRIRENEVREKNDNRETPETALLAKIGLHLQRLAALFACDRYTEHKDIESLIVTREDFELACDFLDYTLASARFLSTGEVETVEVINRDKKVQKLIDLARGQKTLELTRSNFTRLFQHYSKKERDELFEYLKELEALEVKDGESERKRPTTLYIIDIKKIS